MSSPKARLVRARLNAGFKEAKEAAKTHGWKYQTYKSHESGGRQFKLEAALEYARAYGVSAGWLLTGEQEIALAESNAARIPVKRVPVMDTIDIDSLLAVAGGKKPKSTRDITIDSSPDISPRSFAIEIGGTAMLSKDGDSFAAGDIVVVDPDAKPEPGCFVLAVVGGEALFRKYRPLQHTHFTAFELVPLNVFFPTIKGSTDEGAVIVGRAIRHIRKL